MSINDICPGFSRLRSQSKNILLFVQYVLFLPANMPHRVTYSELCMALPSVLFINTRDISSLGTLWIFKRKRLKWRYYGLLRNKYCAKCHNCDVTIIRVIRFCGINQICVTKPVDCPQQEGYFLRAWTCYQSHSSFLSTFRVALFWMLMYIHIHTKWHVVMDTSYNHQIYTKHAS